jgi:hypothetical protein
MNRRPPTAANAWDGALESHLAYLRHRAAFEAVLAVGLWAWCLALWARLL